MGIELARVHVAVRGDTAALRHDMRSARKIVDDSLHRTRSMGIAASTALRDTYGGMVAVLAPVAAIMDKMVFSAVKMASNFEQTKIAFETMMGSAPAAAAMLKSLSDFAKTTPFQIEDVEQGARQLMAVGFAAEEVLPTLKSIGDVSAGIGRGQDGLQRLILNMGQVKAQTRLTGRELRDFAVLGVPLIGELATMFGKTTLEIKELVEAGAITSDHVVLAFERMTSAGGKFADLTAKQSKTVLGLWSNLVDTVSVKLRELGERINDVFNLKGIIKTMMSFVEQITPAMAETLAWAAGFVTLAAAIAGALFTMQALHILMGATFLGGGLGIAIIALSAALGMWITKNREAVVQFYKTNETVQMLKRRAMELAETIRTNLIVAWQKLQVIWAQIKPQVMQILQTMGEVIGTVVGVNALTFGSMALAKAIYSIGTYLAWVAIKWTVMATIAKVVFQELNAFVIEHFGTWQNLLQLTMTKLTEFLQYTAGFVKDVMLGFDLIWNHWDFIWESIVTSGLIKWTKFKNDFMNGIAIIRAGFMGFVGGMVAGFKALWDKIGNAFENTRDRIRIVVQEIQKDVVGALGLSTETEDKEIARLKAGIDKRNQDANVTEAFKKGHREAMDAELDAMDEASQKRKKELDVLLNYQKKINTDMANHFADKEKQKRLEAERTRQAIIASNAMDKFKEGFKKPLEELKTGYQTLFDQVKIGVKTGMAQLGGETSVSSLLKDTGGRVGFAELGNKIQDALLPKDSEQLEALKEGNADRKKLVEWASKLNPLTLFTLK